MPVLSSIPELAGVQVKVTCFLVHILMHMERNWAVQPTAADLEANTR